MNLRKPVRVQICLFILALLAGLITVQADNHAATAQPSTAQSSTVSPLNDATAPLRALKSGPISDFDTFGVFAKSGDILDAGHFTVTVDLNFSAGQADAATGTAALVGEFIVKAGVILTINGDWDASQVNTQNILETGAYVAFAGQSNVIRRYLAASGHYAAASLLVQGNAQNKVFFGLEPNSAATFVYHKNGFLGSNIRGGNIHLNGFSTGYIHDGYDTKNTRDCEMPNVLFTNSGQFQLRYSAAASGSCEMQNLTVLSPLPGVTTAFKTTGNNAATRRPGHNLNGLSVDGGVEYYGRSEFSMNDWVVRDLAATLPDIGWPDADSWLLYDVDTIPVGSALTSNIYFRNEKKNPHGFILTAENLTGFGLRELDSVIFDFVNHDAGESGDMYLLSGPAVLDETVRIKNNVSLKNLNGNQSSTFVTFNGSEQNGRRLVLENNVVFIPPNNRAIAVNEASRTPQATLSRIKNNVFWGDDDARGFVVGNLGIDSAIDIVAAGAYSHNGVFNARNDGNHGELDLPLTYTPEQVAITDAPRFIDDSRRLDTFATKVLALEGDGEAAFYAYLTRHLSVKDIKRLKLLADHLDYVKNHKGSIVVKDLIDWIKQGFIATTTSYRNSADDDGPLGLDTLPDGFILNDADGDSVDDHFDQCAATAAGDSIDSNGCADSQKDDDGDGISNAADICPQTTEDDVVVSQGCSDAEISGKISGFEVWGVGGGGAMAGYSINPFDDKMRFVGTDMGTAFRSINSGINWAPISHEQTTYSSLLGYAAGFGFAGATTVLHAPQGLKPVRSVNGGQTFKAAASFALVYSDDHDAANDERITGWYSDTLNIGTLYAMTNKGLWRSADAGDHWQFVFNGGDVKGMFIDNVDQGKIFVATENAIVSSTNGIDFSHYFSPADHKIHRFGGGSNADGKTLTYASDEGDLAIGRSQAPVYRLHSGDVVASYNKPSNAGIEASAGMIYISKNNGDFALTPDRQFVGSHLVMAQNDPQTIYATGSRSWGRDKGTSVYVSADAGQSWQLALLQFDWNANFTAWDGSKLEHSPVGLNVGWFDSGYYTVGINQLNSGQFGGSGNFFLFGTENSGNQWVDLTNNYKGTTPDSPDKADVWQSSGLNVTSVYDIKFHPADNNDIYATYADIHGVRSTDHGNSWKILPSSENSIYDHAFDQNDANTVFMVNGNHHGWPLENLSVVGRGGVFKSSNKGDSWQRLTAEHNGENRQYLSIGYDSGNDIIYAGSHSNGILRAEKVKGSYRWQSYNQGLPEKLGKGYKMDLVIPQIEVLPNGNVYALVTGVRPELTQKEIWSLQIPDNWLITDASGETTRYFSWINASQTGIYWLDVVNGATQWQLLRGSIDTDSHPNWNVDHIPWQRPMSFAIDPDNPDVLWLTDMAFKTLQTGATGVWKSTDHGKHWKFMLQHTVAVDIDVSPNDSDYVVVAGIKSWLNGGMFVTKDGGQSWISDTRAPLQDHAHSVCFDPQHPDKIIYGYFGGGILYGDKL